ncbi:MAG: hypothetical protein SGARI_004594, partial [Bacillariaceae sp.]
MFVVLTRSVVRVRAWQAHPLSTAARTPTIHQRLAITQNFRARPMLRHHRQTNTRLFATFPDDASSSPCVSNMENLYTEWTLEHDQLLWKHHHESTTAELAALLGRGLRGVESRLEKLNDVDSAAYERLFANNKQQIGNTGKNKRQTIADDDGLVKKEKLVPAGEVLRRIQWDYTLSSSDFSILHYDRVEDAVMETPLDAPNDTIQGSGELLIDALPEHRIVAIKYKEQTVWDREQRMDLFFAVPGIESIVAGYDEWKRNRDAQEDWMRLRRAQVDAFSESMLGLERYHEFWAMCETLESNLEDHEVGFSVKKETETFVQSSMHLFHQSYCEMAGVPPDANQKHKHDLEIVEMLSEIAAVSPNEDFRTCVLDELQFFLCRLEGKPMPKSINTINNLPLPEISEDDIAETFVKGGGSGGQKVNKTSSKVV